MNIVSLKATAKDFFAAFNYIARNAILILVNLPDKILTVCERYLT